MLFYSTCFLITLLGFNAQPVTQSNYTDTQDANNQQSELLRPGTVSSPTIHAIKLPLHEEIQIDGFLNETIWQQAPVAVDFTQRTPFDGHSATEETEVRILYTDQYIYVGFMAYDSAPDSITAPLYRRDGNQPSDWVYINLDSYDDKRTAFTFAVNPRGVQKDILYFDDVNEDILWDAVWEASAQILENGWSAEIKIPLSQVRFSTSDGEQEWGVNFQRRIARKSEISYWAPTSINSNRLASRFGRLKGLYGLPEPKRFEILPYIAGNLVREPNPSTGNPFFSANQFSTSIGGDIRYGLTSNLTLTATINPDFGQVEADPSIINLTANESFFSERRPFFLEGSEIFRFGQTRTYSRFTNTQTFYSRRIGRSPQGHPSRAVQNVAFTDMPNQTTIAAAAKLSGKTESGWSIGALNAVTIKEFGDYILEGGTESRVAVEPATNYFLSRLKKDFNGGNTYVGGFISSVNRAIDDTYFDDFLRRSAYLAGVDAEHNFGNRNWVASGYFSVSSVQGSENSIDLAQRSSVRYLNRVDAKNLTYDPSRTSLSGYSTELSLQKYGGDDKWLGSVTYNEASPGYEVNDMGFQTRSDLRALNAGIVYRDANPNLLQYFEMWVFTGQALNFDGDHINNSYSTGGSMRFNNLWNANFNANLGLKQYNDRQTRGGPVVEWPQNFNFNVNISTNPNRAYTFNTGTFNRWDDSGSYTNEYWVGIQTRPVTWLQISFFPNIIFEKNTAQYILTTADPIATQTYGNRYVFSEIDRRTIVGSFRLNWTFSTTMSLETFIRPFISSGKYSSFKELSEPRTFNFDVYGDDIGSIDFENGRYIVDPSNDGTGSFSFSNPDFTFRSIQGNAVFRWEYQPGSTLFFVWQQQRKSFDSLGDFDFSRDFNRLLLAKPTNVFLVKLSYWFG